MTILVRVVLFLCVLLLFVFGAKAQEAPNKINCQQVSGEYICEVYEKQTYEDGEALRIASQVSARQNTDLVIGTDSLFVRYVDKTYIVRGYGAGQGTTQELVRSSNVKDLRNELIVLINGIRLED